MKGELNRKGMGTRKINASISFFVTVHGLKVEG